jgi:hypothetical protein
MKRQYSAYRRHYAGLIAFILCVSALTGCGGSPNGSRGKREIPAPGESSETTQDASQTPESNQSNEVQSTASQNIGAIQNHIIDGD